MNYSEKPCNLTINYYAKKLLLSVPVMSVHNLRVIQVAFLAADFNLPS